MNGAEYTPALLTCLEGRPQEATLAGSLLEGLRQILPELNILVQKTQITLKNRYSFGALSLPRRSKDRQAHRLVLTLGLARQLDSPRVAAAAQPYPGRWTHHFLLTSPEDLDGELLAWVREAYDFSLHKGSRR